jgi:membrane protein DedA with SNARE-associated domain
MLATIFAGYYKYLALAGVALVEGPIGSLASGFLVRLGYMSMLPVLLILVAGDLVSDTVYFWLVRKGNAEKYVKKFADKFEFLSKNYDKLDELWEKHGMVTMFLGKFAYGLMVPLIVSAALSKLGYKKFMSYVIPSTIFRYAVYVGLGYFMAGSHESIEIYIYWSILYVPLLALAFVLSRRYILRFLKKGA